MKLIVGLGNVYVTPDSLGPKVINDIEVTRHIIKYLPQYIDENARPVSAVSPGVLGTTGIETSEIIEGIVEKTHPKLLLVIDNLASRSIERISKTIQIADTGIVPGAGVGNTRKEISKNTLGIPVIALGVPSVVESAVMVNDCLDLFIEKLQDEAYRVLYKGTNGGFQLSDDMDFDAACQFRDKCLGMGYDIIYVIQIMG